jgi:lipoate-protein ligase A
MTALDVLPVRTADAAGNMATDFLLLQRYPRPGAARFRHYGWRGLSWTFGYSQRWDWVRARVPAAVRDLCRRPTGGGLVDHSADWTYALVLPRGSVLAEARAVESYRAVHEALAEALGAQGVPAVVKTACEPPAAMAGAPEGEGGGGSGVCFGRAELFDLVHRDTGAKIAGAAQKRAKPGLLLQGSVWLPACGAVGAIDGERLQEDFATALAQRLGVERAFPGWPEWDEEEAMLAERYASEEWIGLR